MDSTISKKEQYLIHWSSSEALDVLFELTEEWGEVSWASKTDLWQSVSVRGNHTLNTLHVWVLGVAVNSEAMFNTVDAKVSWDATKAEDWEALITVIGGNDTTD
jgi:hypothetical protein